MPDDDMPGFDPDRCQWCGETGFDLKGLAHHVWLRCEVVERLAQANVEDLKQWHQSNYEALLATSSKKEPNNLQGDKP